MQAVQNGTISSLPRAFWITMSTFTAFFTVYCLVHFSIFTDGYYHTCRQYRITLEKLLGIHGTIIPVIHSRLACSGVFDFMDYVQPDTGIGYREGFINTAAALLSGIVASCLSWIVFFNIMMIYVKMTKKKR